MELMHYTKYLVTWLQNQVKAANAKGLVVGISGGIDSAVCAKLIQLAFPNNHLAVIMPCHSNPEDEKLAQQLATKLAIKTTKIDLTSTYDTFHQQFLLHKNNKNYQLAAANSKARLRMTTLYTIAQTHNYLVVGTDNADEWYTGYFTKYGDGGADLVPIINLLKSQVVLLAQQLKIPTAIIDRAPTAGLWANQTDEKELGFTYNELDAYLLKQEINPNTIIKIETLHQNSQHKRQLPTSPNKLQKLRGD